MPSPLPPPLPSPHPAGLWADGPALDTGAWRDALRLAMQQLGDAQASTGHLRPAAMCQALTEAARALAGLHAYSAAESHLAQAQHWAALMGGHDLLADLHCAWAEVATNAADANQAQGEPAASRAARDRARDQAFEAARAAGLCSDPNWEIRVLLRSSDVLDRCGDHDDAVQLQQRALVLMGLGLPNWPVDDLQGASPAMDNAPMTAPGALM